MRRALSPRTTSDLERAEHALSYRSNDDLSFSNVDRCLRWFYPAKERMQHPQSPRFRGEQHKGETVIVDVDGGKGGDVAEVLTTVSVVGDALRALQLREPQAHYIVTELAQNDTSERKLAEKMGMSRGAVGKLRAQGEAILAGYLIARDVVR